MLFRTQRSPIVFDPGAAALRACQVERRGRGFGVREWFSQPRDASSAPGTPNLVEPRRLARLARCGAFQGREVGLVLAPPQIGFHPLKAPAALLGLPAEEAQQALAWEIARDTRTDATALEVRYWALPAGHTEGLNVMAVSIAADDVRAWSVQFAAEGYALRRVEAAPCAQARAALWHAAPQRGEGWVIADLGLRRTVITTMLADVPVYVRGVSLSARDWTNRLAAIFDIPYSDADLLKARYGLTSEDDDAGGAGAEITNAVRTVLRDDLELLTRELLLCFKYALESYPSAVAGRVFLTGGSAALRGLCEYLAANTGLQVEPLCLRTPRAAPIAPGTLPEVSTDAGNVVGAGVLALEVAA